MKIVIDIPEKDVPSGQEIKAIYLHFIDGKVCECSYPYKVLPKGHGRLIDADRMALLSNLFCYTKYTGIDEAPYEDATKALEFAPTIIEAGGGNMK